MKTQHIGLIVVKLLLVLAFVLLYRAATAQQLSAVLTAYRRYR